MREKSLWTGYLSKLDPGLSHDHSALYANTYGPVGDSANQKGKATDRSS